MALFFSVGAVLTTYAVVGLHAWVVVGPALFWDTFVLVISVSWLLRAWSIVLHDDGTLVVRAPVRVLRVHASHVRAIRDQDPSNTTEWAGLYELRTTEWSIALPPHLVRRDVEDALRTWAPGMTLPNKQLP